MFVNSNLSPHITFLMPILFFLPSPELSFHQTLTFLVLVCCLQLQCELDIMFHLEKVHFMLEEMVMNGCIVETSKTNILTPIQLMDKAS